MGTLTQAGRDRATRKFAIRYLGKLRQATKRFAPSTAPAWHSDYAIGFLAGHVTVGVQAAFAKDELASFHKPWPSSEEVFALARELIPTQMGFQPLSFRRACDDVVKRWPMGNENVTPVAEGALLANRILTVTLTPSELRPEFDAWMKRIDAIEKEFSRLPGRNPVLRLVWRDPSRLYRYLVLHTLGANVFGISSETARRYALEG
jgi:hypothetical protein